MAENFLDTIRNFIEETLQNSGLTYPPYSGIFFVFVTLFISLLANLLNSLLLDMDTMTEESKIMSIHSENSKLARQTGDQKLWIRVQRNEPFVQEIQQKSTLNRMVPMLVTYAPFIFIFSTLRVTFQATANLLLNGDPSCVNSCGGTVVFPFRVPETFPVLGAWFSPFSGDVALSIAGFGFWYFLSAIVTSSIALRIFGINLSRNPQQRAGMM